MDTTDTLVSVIMPVFNGGTFLPAALECIRAQDHPRIEIIVVDDGSNDQSSQIVQDFSKSWYGRIQLLTHPGRRRMGIAASYRLGLQHCQGEYIAFLEQDDIWAANKISEQVKVFDTFPKVGVVFSDVYICDEDGRFAAKAFKTLINKPPSQRPFDAFWRLLWGNCVSTFSNTMIRRELITISDILSEPAGFQDWMLLVLLSSRCKFYHCNRTKVYWRQHQSSYHLKLRRLHGYRKSRRLALKNAIDKMWQENGASPASRLLRESWYSGIWLLNAAENMADYLNRKVRNGETTTPVHNTPLTKP